MSLLHDKASFPSLTKRVLFVPAAERGIISSSYLAVIICLCSRTRHHFLLLPGGYFLSLQQDAASFPPPTRQLLFVSAAGRGIIPSSYLAVIICLCCMTRHHSLVLPSGFYLYLQQNEASFPPHTWRLLFVSAAGRGIIPFSQMTVIICLCSRTRHHSLLLLAAIICLCNMKSA